MSYRIRYGVRKKRHRWWVLSVAGVMLAAAVWDRWYWELARYVGESIRGAG